MKNKYAFTMAEIMITFLILGFLAAILVPLAYKSSPNQDIMRFQKGNELLSNAISKMINSEKYYVAGDFGIKASGADVTEADFFCKSLAETMEIKDYKCKNTSSTCSGSNTVELEDIASEKTKDGKDVDKVIDCICGKITSDSNVSTITTYENDIIYEINPGCTFGSKTGNIRTFSHNLELYKVFCLDVDKIGSGIEPFGYGIRADGKMILGARTKYWLTISKSEDLENGKDVKIDSSSCGS